VANFIQLLGHNLNSIGIFPPALTLVILLGLLNMQLGALLVLKDVL
jgi:hypothetical protein